MQFHYILYLLTFAVALTTANQFLIYKLKRRSVLHRYLIFLNAYTGGHAFYLIMVEEFFSATSWLDYYAPFFLMYGPFLYFTGKSILEIKLRPRIVLLHMFPFLIFFMVFLYIIIAKQKGDFTFTYYKVLNIFNFFSYTLYIAWAMRSTIKSSDTQAEARKLFFISSIILLIFVAIIAMAVLLSKKYWLANHEAVYMLRSLVYLCLIGSAFTIFRFLVDSVTFYSTSASSRQYKKESKIEAEKQIGNPTTYVKSPLTDEQIDEYAINLEKLMLVDKVYLDVDLSLQKLAQLLRIPSHHLTQVLNLKLKLGFYDYVNGYRIKYACSLIQLEEESNLEELSLRCGFKAKASFNRNFKARMGCVPSVYRERHQVQSNS